MSLTVADLKDKLKTLDECLLLEVLEINSEDIVERFEDFIEDKHDSLEEEWEEDKDEEEPNDYI